MGAYKSLSEALDGIVIYGGEEGEDEWTLGELEADASWDIRQVIVRHLETLRRPVPKPVFGDTTPVKNTQYNAILEELIQDIEEGKL